MRGVNKVILVGTLGRDPEMKYAANGNAIVNLSVATSEQRNDKQSGQKQEKTEWHRVVMFGKLAEVAGQYLTKGSQVYLEGKLQTRKWQDQNTGQDRYSTEIVVDGFSGKMQMLGGGSRQGDAPFNAKPANSMGGGMGQGQPGMQTPNQRVAPQGGQANYGQQAPQAPMQNQAPPMQQAPAYPESDFGDDDVPF